MEKLEYIDNVINLIVKDNLINSLEDIINDLRKEECFDEDIYEYINKVVLTILHTKYGDILKQLKDS
ncbi:hypothetical protein N9525_02570 [Flavobacteriaceae bacterium]|nr:hypothetical protein [Flavobacteriaceae bacterium]